MTIVHQEAANFIKSKCGKNVPKIMIICGTGLGPLSNELKNRTMISYKDIPNYPSTTILGHKGELAIGQLNGIWVICALGRFHYYEGNSMDIVAFPVRVAYRIGIELLIVTNAAGGLQDRKHKGFSVGDVMQITDHVALPCLSGNHPLRGPNIDVGPRFVPMDNAYDKSLIKKCDAIIKSLNYENSFKKGVYCMVSGPSYETPAECKFLRLIGDAVGMSTCPEVIVARHCGIKVVGFSLITNIVVDEDSTTTTLVVDQSPNKKKKLEDGSKKDKEAMHLDVIKQAELHVGRLAEVISELVKQYQ